MTKILLGISLCVNVLLAVLLAMGTGRSTPPPAKSSTAAAATPLCSRLPGDLDFFAEGLVKGNDAYYSPLLVRFFEPVLVECLPAHKKEIETAMVDLRQQLLYIVAHNVPETTKRTAHDRALQIFRDLRALFGIRS